MLSFKL